MAERTNSSLNIFDISMIRFTDQTNSNKMTNVIQITVKKIRARSMLSTRRIAI